MKKKKLTPIAAQIKHQSDLRAIACTGDMGVDYEMINIIDNIIRLLMTMLPDERKQLEISFANGRGSVIRNQDYYIDCGNRLPNRIKYFDDYYTQDWNYEEEKTQG